MRVVGQLVGEDALDLGRRVFLQDVVAQQDPACAPRPATTAVPRSVFALD